jgi:hypothetical protein
MVRKENARRTRKRAAQERPSSEVPMKHKKEQSREIGTSAVADDDPKGQGPEAEPPSAESIASASDELVLEQGEGARVHEETLNRPRAEELIDRRSIMPEPEHVAPNQEGSPKQPESAQGQASTTAEEYVLTIAPDSREIVKVERLESGRRIELTEEEYASFSGLDPSQEPDFYAEFGEYDAAAYAAGYNQALADIKAEYLQSESMPKSSAEAAYYQAVADYQAYFGQ